MLIFFSIQKKKFQIFQQPLLNSDVSTAYNLSRWKFWEIFPENTCFCYHFWNMTGSLSDYVGKKLTWANFFSFLAKVFQLAWQNWKPFVHLSSLKLLKNSENHRGTTLEKFWNFRKFWIHVEHRARNFRPFDKNFTGVRFKADFHVSRENIWRKNAFLKDFGTLSKSSLSS